MGRPTRTARDRIFIYLPIALVIVIVFFSCLPYFVADRLPRGLAEWLSVDVPIVAVIGGALVVIWLAGRAVRVRHDLLTANEELRISVASGLVGDENLRVSVASGLAGDENLRVAVASGLEGDENLRAAVASGLVGDEKLRVAVAEGLVGDEKLRVSVADGIVGAEALRMSVADGLDGAEALRLSISQGLDAASAALAVVDTVDAGITFYDPDGEILLTNDTARALAVSGDPAIGHPLVFEDDRVTPIAQIDQILARAARGQLVTRRAYWVGTGTSQRAMMATSQYVRRASGELLGTVVATHDVTPLASAIRSRDEFLETVSHELRTPLTSMIGYLEVIEDMIDVSTAGIEHEFRVVQRNSQRLLKLIVDLLLTAEGQTSVERRPFDIAEIARNSLNAIRPAAATAGVRVLDPALESVIAEVDADRIGDVLDKLLSNAVKFSGPGCTVSLAVRREESEVVVTITDNGAGIGTDDQLHIFERFFRSSVARTGVVAGAGLGLSTAKVIVDSHRGSIAVRSELGVGSTFEVRLPLVA